MANNFNNMKDAPGVIAKVAAQTLKDNLQFGRTISMADKSDFDGKNGYGAGGTIYTSKPARFIPQNTFDITSSMQDIVEEKVPLTLDIIETVGVNIDSFEFATEIQLKEVLNRVVIPAAESIAQNVELEMIKRATRATYNSVGTAGSNTFAVADVLAGRTKLNQNLCPTKDRSFLMNSASGALAVDARKGLFQSSEKIAEQYIEGMVGMSDGFKWYESELIHYHTNGSDVTGGAINNASTAEGASAIVVDGFSAAPAVGSVFTIAGVFAVHPITKQVYPFLQQFTVTAATTTSISISPSLYAASGGLQNVSALPADDAALTFVGSASTSYAQPLQYHKNAFKMVSVPLIMPTKAEVAAQETVDGYTVAVIRDFDVLTRKMITRLDFLGGISAVRPEWACRVTA